MLAAALGALGFVVSWYVIHHGWYALDRQWDTIEYAKYAHKILDLGLVPYRDFTVEYPPLALPVFVFPGWIAGSQFSGYMEIFGLTMAICGVMSVSCSALILAAQRVGTRRLVSGVALVAFSPVLLGALLLSRYDLFPAVLSIAALTAIYFGWERSGFALLALGAAAKAYPAVLVPIAAVYVWRNHGRRQALVCLTIFGGLLLACFLPFVIIAPHGIWGAIHGQASRPPQIESLGAAVFLAAHQLIGTHLSYYFTHHSDNLNGHPAFEFASAMSVLQIIALLAVWLFYARGPATRERLLTGGAAAVCAFIVFGRVLSPQYLIWLAPLVVVVPGRRGAAAMAMLACAMCMTQIWYPLHFTALKNFQPLESWAVIGRDLVLLALFGTLAWPDVPLRRSMSAAARDPAPGDQVMVGVTVEPVP
ncbi:MAG: hypothetical protein ACXVRW_16040 [Solirubrobacteraceae bacterium]